MWACTSLYIFKWSCHQHCLMALVILAWTQPDYTSHFTGTSHLTSVVELADFIHYKIADEFCALLIKATNV